MGLLAGAENGQRAIDERLDRRGQCGAAPCAGAFEDEPAAADDAQEVVDRERMAIQGHFRGTDRLLQCDSDHAGIGGV
jgi:hypothetical protein